MLLDISRRVRTRGERQLTKANKRDEEANSGSHGHYKRLRHYTHQPLSESEQGQEKEDDSVMSQSVISEVDPLMITREVYPSRNTAPMASRYVTVPEPWNPTIE